MNPLEPGAAIHASDPFAAPEQGRSAVRRLRGRLASAVTLWTTTGPAGLTVSSMMVADGEPGRVLGLIDEESDFYDAVQHSRVFAVTPLQPGDQQLADRFAGLMPAPGGLFATGAWTPTEYGPVPQAAGTWAGCRLTDVRPAGWSLLLDASVEVVRTDTAPVPLLHFRGRYHRLGD